MALNGYRPAPTWETETCFSSSWTAIGTSTIPPTVARWHVSRVHPSEQRRRRRRPDPGSVPVSRRVREPSDLGLYHVAGFRRRHVGASIHEAWTESLRSVRDALDANLDDDRATLLRVTTQELGPTREDVLEAVTTRLDVSRKQAAEAYALAETYEANPRSVWGYVQGLTRLSQRTPWQDARFNLDQAASRLIAMVN